MVSLVLSQNFPALQAETMVRRIGRKFQVPAASLSVFQLVALSLWSGCYDRFIFPLLVTITGKPTGLSLKQRMGIGMLLAALATTAAPVVEAVPRKKAVEEGAPAEPAAVVRMSLMWLVLQYIIVGLAEAFSVIAQVEFFYSELPKSINSFAVALWTLGFRVANMVGTLIVKLADTITGRDGRESWLASDCYYVILTLLVVANFFYFLVCSRAYGEEGKKKKTWQVEVEEDLL